MSNINLKDVASVGAGAVIGVGAYKLVRKILDARTKKKFGEPVDIDENEYDVEVEETEN